MDKKNIIEEINLDVGKTKDILEGQFYCLCLTIIFHIRWLRLLFGNFGREILRNKGFYEKKSNKIIFKLHF